MEKGTAALEQINSEHGSALKGSIAVLQLDITDQGSVGAAVKHIDAEFGKLDVLLNNAGILVHAPDVDTLAALRQSFETNVFATMLVTEALEPLLRKAARPPYVIYVSSEMGSVTRRLDPAFPFKQIRGEPYRMAKAALNMLAACHRYNFAEWGCKVCAFNPGWCVSNLTGAKGREMRIKAGARDPKEPAKVLAEIAMGKRDADVEKNGMVDVDGGVGPW